MSDVKLSVINTNVKGVLAARFGYDLPIRVLSSRAGYYIGTFSETHGVVSRESQYFDKRIDAEEAFRKGTWTQRRNP